MTRTTISLHETTLAKVRDLSRSEQLSLGETITELLNLGIECKKAISQQKNGVFTLKTASMGQPKVPLEDKEAIYHLVNEKG